MGYTPWVTRVIQRGFLGLLGLLEFYDVGYYGCWIIRVLGCALLGLLGFFENWGYLGYEGYSLSTCP